MIYCRTINVEKIAVHPMNDVNNTQCVELTKYGDKSVFSVYMSNCEDEWLWEFDISNPSDYERVKLCIFDTIFECDTMTELAYTLDSIFRNGLKDILIEDEYEDCVDYDGYGCYQ